MRQMIGALTVAATLAYVAVRTQSALAAAAEAGPSEAEIRAVVRQRVAKLGPEAAMVVGWVDERGSRVVAVGKGVGGKAVDGDTVFEIGSVTKAFTGLLLAEMVGKGEVKLEDPVGKYLPKPVARVPSRGGKEIRLVDLATHTSGLPRLPENLAPKDPGNPYADYTVEQLYAFLSGYTLSREVGAEYEYSNLGAGLLGQALALRGGGDYEAMVVGRICTPLGMEDTRVTLSDAMRSRLVPGHTEEGAAAANWDMPTLAGCGALRSTANDMLKFVSANLGLTPSPLEGAMDLSHKARAEAGSEAVRIGLGWHVLRLAGGEIVWHNGGTGGYHSFVGLDKAKKRGVVVLVNFSADIDDVGLRLLSPKPAVAAAAKPAGRVAVAIDPKLYDLYVGTYRFAPGVDLEVRREKDQLQAKLTGQTFLPIYPESETKFFYKVVDAQLTFRRTAAGAVTGVVLHQNGRNQLAKRVE